MRASFHKLVTAADREGILPVAKARKHLRVDGTTEDELIGLYVGAAIDALQESTGRSFGIAAWQCIVTGAWAANDPVMLPRSPLSELTSVEYRNTAGEWTEWEGYTLRETSNPPTVWLTDTPGDIDAPDHDEDSVWRINFEAGYEAGQLPDSLRAAVLLMAAHLYENREAVSDIAKTEIPLGVDRLIQPFRVPWGGSL